MIGIAGVHLVAADLAVNGIIGTVTSRNTQGINRLASRPDGLRNVGVQVKTSACGDLTWMLHQKAEDHQSNDFFYVFVELTSGTERPDFFVVPSRKVARFVKITRQAGLKSPGRGSRKHRDSGMRNFWFDDEKAAAKYRRK